MLRRIDFLILTMSMFLLSCSSPESGMNGELSSFCEFNSDCWPYSRKVNLTFRSADTIMINGNLRIAIRHDNSYPFANIYLEVATPTTTDTINIPLCDNFGNWYGKGSAMNKLVEASLPHTTTLSTADTVRVRHIMRVDTLRGINLVGVTLP